MVITIIARSFRGVKKFRGWPSIKNFEGKIFEDWHERLPYTQCLLKFSRFIEDPRKQRKFLAIRYDCPFLLYRVNTMEVYRHVQWSLL